MTDTLHFGMLHGERERERERGERRAEEIGADKDVGCGEGR